MQKGLFYDKIIYIYQKIFMKSDTKKLSIAISEEIYKKIEDGNYNKNKLVNKLLENYLQTKQK